MSFLVFISFLNLNIFGFILLHKDTFSAVAAILSLPLIHAPILGLGAKTHIVGAVGNKN